MGDKEIEIKKLDIPPEIGTKKPMNRVNKQKSRQPEDGALGTKKCDTEKDEAQKKKIARRRMNEVKIPRRQSG